MPANGGIAVTSERDRQPGAVRVSSGCTVGFSLVVFRLHVFLYFNDTLSFYYVKSIAGPIRGFPALRRHLIPDVIPEFGVYYLLGLLMLYHTGS